MVDKKRGQHSENLEATADQTRSSKPAVEGDSTRAWDGHATASPPPAPGNNREERW